jgi:hypothetical protein
MSEEKLYAVSVRETVACRWATVTSKTGKPLGLPKRRVVNLEIAAWLKEPGVLTEVTFDDIIEDMKKDFSQSKYVKMLGWNYAQACRFAERDGVVLVLTMCSDRDSRPYSYAQSRDDDDYAFQLVSDIYATRGGQIYLEEFDPERHIEGYRLQLDM